MIPVYANLSKLLYQNACWVINTVTWPVDIPPPAQVANVCHPVIQVLWSGLLFSDCSRFHTRSTEAGQLDPTLGSLSYTSTSKPEYLLLQ